MSRLSRVRRIAKWTGVVVCVVFAAEWAVNSGYAVHYARGGFAMFVGGGQTRIYYTTTDKHKYAPGFAFREGLTNTRRLLLPEFHQYPADSVTFVDCPLWLPSLLVALPTAYLFYRDRRPPRGHCQGCGYDLKGNVSGVCPECGKELEPASVTS